MVCTPVAWAGHIVPVACCYTGCSAPLGIAALDPPGDYYCFFCTFIVFQAVVVALALARSVQVDKMLMVPALAQLVWVEMVPVFAHTIVDNIVHLVVVDSNVVVVSLHIHHIESFSWLC